MLKNRELTRAECAEIIVALVAIATQMKYFRYTVRTTITISTKLGCLLTNLIAVGNALQLLMNTGSFGVNFDKRTPCKFRPMQIAAQIPFDRNPENRRSCMC